MVGAATGLESVGVCVVRGVVTFAGGSLLEAVRESRKGKGPGLGEALEAPREVKLRQ